ncbi:MULTISPECIES: Lrp/AsnC family transcriptional regulator [Arcicella]|uniref:Lrp/AsnC family transcriptional regulator n=1 Tax=Arcicella aquatica TaxID=217141 RepID=A0ABU5QHY8_9BACT|nr:MULTISPECIES: Lrp/AsnC family transcriptional regulator [Arcicella]MDR6560598.1 DNA-binding Lrp family transcriptional regulator [Arcicella sp. BE51]MDR6810482.1 DNA-binding Lrp family transcriptional regulator [Arcicella sp. BE140]MDR6821832.1 DNA-binding Lrp family transcriptional regulator [Arcicella sp. BE139]MEA5256550.1 Lrp/AsnC family transcriptional regulator [Arcicella aquatica]
MAALDNIDLKILQFLQANALMTNKEIAARLNLTTTPIHERIKRLESEGVIEKYTAILNKSKLGKSLVVLVDVTLKEHAASFLEQFEKDVLLLPEVVECYCISGGSDFLLKVLVRDMDEYRHFILHKLATLSNIGNAQSRFVVNEIKSQTPVPIEVI